MYYSNFGTRYDQEKRNPEEEGLAVRYKGKNYYHRLDNHFCDVTFFKGLHHING